MVFKFLVTMDVADVERMLDDRMFSGSIGRATPFGRATASGAGRGDVAVRSVRGFLAPRMPGETFTPY